MDDIYFVFLLYIRRINAVATSTLVPLCLQGTRYLIFIGPTRFSKNSGSIDCFFWQDLTFIASPRLPELQVIHHFSTPRLCLCGNSHMRSFANKSVTTNLVYDGPSYYSSCTSAILFLSAIRTPAYAHTVSVQ